MTDNSPSNERLLRQIEFILEIDRLKTVLRRTVLTDRSRNENSAEHSWHLAMMAILLAEHAVEPIDLQRVLEMVLVHDLVEIDAGDTFCYDAEANRDKEKRERQAAERIFGLLPDDQRRRLRELWEEFEARETTDARFANALDRMQPMLSNLATLGHSWQEYGIALSQVIARNAPMAEGSQVLWDYMKERLDQAVDDGLLDGGSGVQMRASSRTPASAVAPPNKCQVWSTPLSPNGPGRSADRRGPRWE